MSFQVFYDYSIQLNFNSISTIIYCSLLHHFCRFCDLLVLSKNVYFQGKLWIILSFFFLNHGVKTLFMYKHIIGIPDNSRYFLSYFIHVLNINIHCCCRKAPFKFGPITSSTNTFIIFNDL